MFRQFFQKVFLSGLMLSLASQACAEGKRDPVAWLEKMQRAAIEENYVGTFMFSRGGMSSSMRIVHRFLNQIEEERLTQLDGEMGEIIRKGDEVMCVLPDNRVVKLKENKLANKVVQAFADFMPNHAFYELNMAGYSRLIDRAAVKLAVKARDTYRYSYVLSIDKSTGLLLKSSLVDAKGQELEHFQFTAIDFPDEISDVALKPMNSGQVVTHEFIPPVKLDQRWPSNMLWNVNWTPPGYVQVNQSDEPGDNVMLFTDGLATYSVFIEMVETDINSLCDEYMRLAYHGLRAKDKSFNADIEMTLQNVLAKIKVVPQDISRVILNIMTNAFQAVQAKSQNTAKTTYSPKVRCSTLSEGDKVIITISDNGMGIPEDIREKIFQPFFTTKPTGQGTGLGLSMAYDIVKAHGGELSVESEGGKGTDFKIVLPL